ncbi:trypsin-7-like [Agrilus planipennis]|uniref:Trypsin-7-like n=1 Tax=Agrilus planipennis TaxID=224129 RepID=A0A1W4XL60_AGRPL|nr:trypsin-7-like [Agrilus planipennis]
MNPTIAVYSLFSLLGYFNIIIAASIPADVESTPSYDRVIGGSHVLLKDHPYQVSVHYSSSPICAGSIISKSFILTAAYCVLQKSASRYSIRAGSIFQDSDGVVKSAKRIYVSPKYNPKTSDSDIALISLKSALNFGENINAVSLPSPKRKIPAGTAVNTTGWGEGIYNYRLRGFIVPVVSKSQCQKSYKLTSTMLCAGSSVEHRSTCQGQSGGPLVSNRYGQVGVVSFGSGCSYRVYSSVPALRKWIKSVSGV